MSETQVLPAVPMDVLDYSIKHNIVQYLRPILEMTRGIFATETIALVLEEDPDISDCQSVDVQVDVTGWTANDMLEARHHWIDQLFQACPATEVWHFRIRMVQTA